MGPVTISQLAGPLSLSRTLIEIALLNLEQEGFVVQGRLLARIHRYTINRLRSEIEPVSLADYMQLLFDCQGLTDKGEGVESVSNVLQQLEGYSAAAGAWETDILPARIALYTQDQLETLCVTGRFSWLRLHISNTTKQGRQKNPPVSQTPISLLQRHH